MTATEWMQEARAYLSTFHPQDVSQWALNSLLCSVRNTGNYTLWNKAREANFWESRA